MQVMEMQPLRCWPIHNLSGLSQDPAGQVTLSAWEDVRALGSLPQVHLQWSAPWTCWPPPHLDVLNNLKPNMNSIKNKCYWYYEYDSSSFYHYLLCFLFVFNLHPDILPLIFRERRVGER